MSRDLYMFLNMENVGNPDFVEKTFRQQFAVFESAMNIFANRELARGGLWARHDESDKLHHMKSKLARIEAGLQMLPSVSDENARMVIVAAVLDDAHDLINYTAFLVRLMTGETPDA